MSDIDDLAAQTDHQEVRCTLTRGGATASKFCFKFNAAECWNDLRDTLSQNPLPQPQSNQSSSKSE